MSGIAWRLCDRTGYSWLTEDFGAAVVYTIASLNVFFELTDLRYEITVRGEEFDLLNDFGRLGFVIHDRGDCGLRCAEEMLVKCWSKASRVCKELNILHQPR